MPASKVLMVEPLNFISNPQTAGDNFFQSPEITDEKGLSARAKAEFDLLVKKIREAGIEVSVYAQHDNLITPDAVFPNNWFSTLPDKTLILYPMMAENRRLERRKEITDVLLKDYPRLINLTHDELRYQYLEGTGSLVLDHQNKIAYASLSKRTDQGLSFEWSKHTGYQITFFSSYDTNGNIIYHTNVLMCVAEKFAIICLDALGDNESRLRVTDSLIKTQHEIIPISLEQMHHFCGNCLELENKKGEPFLVMSTQALEHFTDSQIQVIENYDRIIHSDLSTIETYGGGGARCMLAELF